MTLALYQTYIYIYLSMYIYIYMPVMSKLHSGFGAVLYRLVLGFFSTGYRWL